MSVYDWDYAPKFPHITPKGFEVMSTEMFMSDEELTEIDYFCDNAPAYMEDGDWEDPDSDGYGWERRALAGANGSF